MQKEMRKHGPPTDPRDLVTKPFKFIKDQKLVDLQVALKEREKILNPTGMRRTSQTRPFISSDKMA